MQTKTILWALALLLFNCGASPDQSTQSTPPEEDRGQSTQSTLPEEQERQSTNQPINPDTFGIAYLTGRFDPAAHPDFTLIDPADADREGLYLRKDAYEAFKKMSAAAGEEGIRLIIRSAARNFDYQRGIWEAKWTGARTLSSGENAAEAYPDPRDRALKILEWSSMPGASRHHWGTDIDLNAFNNEYFTKGEGKKIYDWLTAHAHEYGFCRPYTEKGPERPYGYNEEKWHWSYEPVSRLLTREAEQRLRDDMIRGFKGAEAAEKIGVVEKYVLGVNAACRE